ncbi:MAG: hypothetical protein V4726_07230 [Verrucomicrobiota bacterium]
MSLTAADIIAIIQAGGSVSIGSDGSMSIGPADAKRRMTAAEKQQAYRDRRKSVTGVTGKVTPDGETVTGVTGKVTYPSPPPLPPGTPNPTPTPGEHTRVCEAPENPDGLIPEIPQGKAEETPEIPGITDPPDGDDSKPSRFPFPPPAAAALQRHFRRRPATPWGKKEIAAARRLRLPEDQLLADLALFAKAKAAGWEYYRKDTLTLLNNWQAEVERSEDFLKTVNTPKNGTDSRTNRPPVSRNAAPLDPNRPSLNATAVNGSAADLAKYGRPDPDENGKSYW